MVFIKNGSKWKFLLREKWKIISIIKVSLVIFKSVNLLKNQNEMSLFEIFIYFSLNKIFQFGLFLMTKLSIIMIYCSKVVVLFFWPLNPSHHPCEKWILLILMIIKHTTWQWEHAWLQYNPILSCKVCVDLLDTIFSYFSRKMWNG